MPPKSDPYWWEEFSPFTQAPDELPQKCGVVVVGAGLTGCSAALTLAKAGTDTVLLEANRPGYGASTRNGGMIGGGYRLSLAQMKDLYGDDTAHALLHESHIGSLEFAEALIKDENIDCDYKKWGRYRGMWNRREYDATAKMVDQLRALLPVNIDMVPPEKQRAEIGTDFYSGGMLLHDHGGLHPAKYLNGLLNAAHRAGAAIYGQTPVVKVEKSGDGFLVTTSKGSIRADSVLMATNGYTPGSFAAIRRRVFPVSSFLISTEELPKETIKDIMPGQRMLVETRHRHCYMRLSPDGKRFVLGGRAGMSPIPQGRATRVLSGLMGQVFPQLKSAAISHSWTGVTGFTFSSMPNIGQFDGVWHAMGYSGSGNAMAPYLGHKAALAMIGDKAGDSAFMHTTLQTRPWHRKHPWFLPFGHAVFRAQDVRENLSRAR